SLDAATATAANFELIGPAGAVAPRGLRLRQDATLLDLHYPALAEGDYQIVIHTAAVTDRVGNPLANGDVVSIFHVRTPPPPPRMAEIQAGRRTFLYNRESVGQLHPLPAFYPALPSTPLLTPL